jgi:hypothetical protein
MVTGLPRELMYLHDAIRQLGEFEPASLGDDNPAAMDVVEVAIRARIAGMTPEQGRATVEKDMARLGKWLDRPEQDDSPAHFIYGAMEGLLLYADFAEWVR